MKRFTATEKWDDQWFRKLSTPAKLLWLYLWDKCDNAGVVSFDLEVASVTIRETIQEKHVTELGDKITAIGDKFLIKSFVSFQFGELQPGNRIHQSVLNLFKQHEIEYPIEYQYTINTPKKRTSTSTGQGKGQEQGQGPTRASAETEDVNGRISNMVEQKQKFQIDQRFKWLEAELCAFYHRPRSQVGVGEEQVLVAGVARRMDVKTEWAAIKAYRHQIEARYFPQSLASLCRDWEKTLDRARNHETPKSEETLLEKNIEAVTRRALKATENYVNES